MQLVWFGGKCIDFDAGMTKRWLADVIAAIHGMKLPVYSKIWEGLATIRTVVMKTTGNCTSPGLYIIVPCFIDGWAKVAKTTLQSSQLLLGTQVVRRTCTGRTRILRIKFSFLADCMSSST